MRIALIGYGEVGQIFARELLAGGAKSVHAYDILVDQPGRADALRAVAAKDGVVLAESGRAAAEGADVIISAVTAASVLDAAKDAASYLIPGRIFFDINSASPGTKTQAAKTVQAAGASYVEGAVMAPVPGPGLRVPILGGGPAARDLAPRLNALGMNIRPVSEEFGRASAMKLCRSIMIKGIEALIVDCAKAAKSWNVEDEVYGSLDESYPSIDWQALAVAMGGRVRQHGVRRGAEMREAAMMLADLDMNPELANAVAAAQERGAGKAGI
ncbi:MAG: NAD(P)-dependent oxidoreductase [Hyphomicrobiales bacterium]|nr:NAD(P)-dependent oxidoreductase [Hyphomicrobiales bacterium]